MSSQKQDASEGANAFQAGGDLTVHQGISSTQMKEILAAVANQFPAHAAIAMQIVNTRISDFERRFLETFASGGAGRSEAVGDPDFLYVLKEAQHAYIRSGDEGVRDTLIDLIARRSKETTRNRLSLTLNEAVETSALLTKNEFAELSLCYLLKYTLHRGLRSPDQFKDYIREMVLPLLPDISREGASYQYLEAQSCATIGSFMPTTLDKILRTQYAGLFSRGFTMAELESCLPEGRKQMIQDTAVHCECLNEPSKIQTTFLSKAEFDQFTRGVALTEPEQSAIWNLVDSTTLKDEDLIKHIEKFVPEIRQLFDLWDKTPLCQLNLTTVGIAIGHSNLVRLCKFNANLNIWIK